MLKAADVYWAAGLMEGEGYFGLRRGKDLIAQITMTDQDVIHRFAATFPIGGKIKERRLPSGKTSYGWTVSHQANAAGFMMTLLPLMGERRGAKIRQCLAGWRFKGPSRKAWTQCSRGHELAGKNLRVVAEGQYLKRRCLQCAALRQRKHRAISFLTREWRFTI